MVLRRCSPYAGWSEQRRSKLLGWAMVVLALHAFVLVEVNRAFTPKAAGGSHGASVPIGLRVVASQHWLIRTIAAPASLPPATQDVAPAAGGLGDTPRSDTVFATPDMQPSADDHHPPKLSATSGESSVESAVIALASDAKPSPDVMVGPNPRTTPAESGGPSGVRSDSGDAGNEQLYLPRSALSRVARPLDPVEIIYPDATLGGQFRAVLLLFVDGAGNVRRMRTRHSDMPSEFENAARDAFFAVRFAPGEVDGRAVKSLYPIEVTFSADPTLRAADAR